MKNEKENLSFRLNQYKKELAKKAKSQNILNQKNNSLSLGLKLATDFVAVIIVGCLIGLGIDKIFNTKPIFFLIFLIFGIAGAFLNIYRTILKLDKKGN